MVVLSRHQQVECSTIDGTKIVGLLFPVEGPAPAIIMSHGVSSLVINSCANTLSTCMSPTHAYDQFNCVKEMTLPETAEAFQALGYNVLIYDARSVGGSGGQPRNLLNPLQMAEDLSGIS